MRDWMTDRRHTGCHRRHDGAILDVANAQTSGPRSLPTALEAISEDGGLGPRFRCHLDGGTL